jgi:tetratricopeptide (TPR) repeat protein
MTNDKKKTIRQRPMVNLRRRGEDGGSAILGEFFVMLYFTTWPALACCRINKIFSLKEDPVTRIFVSFLLFTFAVPSLIAAGDPVKDQQQRAASVLEQAVKADPNNAELWAHLGFAYRKEGQIDQATNAFTQAASLNPNSTDALYMLGLIYESKHQTQEAIQAWKKYLTIETDKNKREMAENHIHHLSE